MKKSNLRPSLSGSPASSPGALAAAQLAKFMKPWVDSFAAQRPTDHEAAFHEWGQAFLGYKPTTIQDRLALDKVNSPIPATWGALFRPLGDDKSKTGLSLFGEKKANQNPTSQSLIKRLAASRGFYGECLDLVNPQTLVLRDFLTGEIYIVPYLSATNPPRRWTRYFGLLCELGDGSHMPVIPLMWSRALLNLTPGEFLDRVEEALAKTGYDKGLLDRSAPSEALRTYAGIAFAPIERWLLAELSKTSMPRRHYCINTDGDRVEYHEAQVAFSDKGWQTLAAALVHAEDFCFVDRSWVFVSRSHTSQHPGGENFGALVPLKGTTAKMFANSERRFVLLLDRLAALAGEAPKPMERQVRYPWELQSQFSPERGAGVSDVVFAARAPVVKADGKVDPRPVSLSNLNLDVEQADLGGIPRELAKNPAQKDKLEEWLRKQELGSDKSITDMAEFVDLDSIRKELGLQTVRDFIVSSAPASR